MRNLEMTKSWSLRVFEQTNYTFNDICKKFSFFSYATFLSKPNSTQDSLSFPLPPLLFLLQSPPPPSIPDSLSFTGYWKDFIVNRFSQTTDHSSTGEPNIFLPVKVGACANSQIEIPLTILNYNELHPNEWSINWRKISPPPAASGTLDTSDPLKLKIKAAKNNGGEYTVFVKNPFGFATGTVKLEITNSKGIVHFTIPER